MAVAGYLLVLKVLPLHPQNEPLAVVVVVVVVDAVLAVVAVVLAVVVAAMVAVAVWFQGQRFQILLLPPVIFS